MICQVPVSLASSQAAEACFPLLLMFFPRADRESKAGKRLGEKALLPGCSRAPQQMPLQPVVYKNICHPSLLHHVRHVGSYKTGVSEDPRVLSSHFLACWVLLCLLGPVVALDLMHGKQGQMLTASATSNSIYSKGVWKERDGWGEWKSVFIEDLNWLLL